MLFDLQKSIEILERTPGVLKTMLTGLSDVWIFNNEGGETWNPYYIVGHLIHGEISDWIPRAQIILSSEEGKNFEPFDRFAQEQYTQGKSLEALLDEFQALREKSLEVLKNLEITPDQLEATGIHPAFGTVTLAQLLSTWTVHDLGHIAQIARVMAKQYKDEVGPWIEYLGILHK